MCGWKFLKDSSLGIVPPAHRRLPKRGLDLLLA